jgi:hypothetical protein
MTDPHINESIRLEGVKEGWYAIDERGRLLSGPFSNQEDMPDKNQPGQGQRMSSKFISSPTDPRWQTFMQNDCNRRPGFRKRQYK